MYKLGVIEECLADSAALENLKPYYFSQRIENVPEDTVPVWHTNEYHIPDEKIEDICKMLSICIFAYLVYPRFQRKCSVCRFVREIFFDFARKGQIMG